MSHFVKYSFETWKEKNKSMIEELYEILLESCEEHEIRIYTGEGFYREFVYYLYHHAYNASVDESLIQCPADAEETERVVEDDDE